MYRAILIKPCSPPILTNIDLTESNICKLDVSGGTELNNVEIEFNNVSLEFTELQNNIYAICVNKKGIQKVSENEYFSPYFTYPLEKNITISGDVKFGDVLIVGAYKTIDGKLKIFPLSLEETDKYINLINSKLGVFA